MNALKTKHRTCHLLSMILLILALCGGSTAYAQGKVSVQAVDAVGMTVSDIDRSVDFYSNVIGFKKISDVEVHGDKYEHLEGVFGLRMRVVRMQLGDESIELTEYFTPNGKPFPQDTRSNDRWFQH
ncbi:MAG: VOC family protein, partial [Thermodesulfobacteriota bacterium]